jgi:hypothetical protein
MIQTIKARLKKNVLIHHAYMRLKRMLNSELLGMTSKTEQEYFARYGAQIYAGKGEIVDLGCWLGSTTIPLLEGLLRNPAFAESDRKVYAYDLFVWYEWMNYSVVGTNLSGRYSEGDNFVEEFKKRTKKYASRIEIREGDLVKIGWNNRPIEFLLIDAMKNWELANAIIKDFFVSLIPGESYILQQDFAHYFTPWIHLLQWRFRDNFEFVEEIPKSQSVVFKYAKKIPAEQLSKNYSFESFTDEEVNSAFEYSIKLVSKEKLPNLAAAKVMWFVHQEKINLARIELDKFLHRGVLLEKDLLTVSELLAQKN